MNIKFDSNEERLYYNLFKQWKEKNILIDFVYHPNSFILNEKVSKKYIEEKQLKTKIKYIVKDYTLINQHKYTTDFKLIWNEKYLDKYFQSIDKIINNKLLIAHKLDNEYITYIEVKPNYDRYNMTRLFKAYIQPIIYNRYNIYIELCKQSKLQQLKELTNIL